MTEPGAGRQAAEEIRTLYHQSPLVLFSNLLVSSIAAWAFMGHPRRGAVLAWLGYQVGLNVLRWALVLAFRHWERPARIRAWARAYAVGALLSGLGWGLLAEIVFDPADARSLLFACVFIAGMVAGSMATLPWHFPSYLCFVLAALAPLTLRCLGQDDKLLFSVGLAGLSYAGFNLVLARRVRAQMVLAVRLSHENLDLVERLRVEKGLAEEASQAKSRFLAAASHDLRQPVNALALYSESLDPSGKKAELRALAGRIQGAARVLAGMLHSLLDLSAIESGARKPQLEAVALGPLLAQLRQEFKAPARRQGVSLHVASSRVWVRSDPEMLGRVLRNLIHNAIRHGKKQVRVACAQTRSGVTLTVSDQGPGIPRSARATVFEEFTQLGNPERDPAQGLGLGLAIVRGLCGSLGHGLALRSVPELRRGTRFSLGLPRAPRPPAQRGSRQDRAQGGLARRRVLVVDDHAASLDATARLLKGWGLAVLAATGPEEARALMRRRGRPHVVLCDYRLKGGLTGVEALRHPAFAGLPAAIFTGDTHAAAQRQLKASGLPVLLKPLSPGRLRALLDNLMRPAER